MVGIRTKTPKHDFVVLESMRLQKNFDESKQACYGSFPSSFCHHEPQHLQARKWPDHSITHGNRGLVISRSARRIIPVFSANCREETKLKWIRGMARVTLVNVNANGLSVRVWLGRSLEIAVMGFA